MKKLAWAAVALTAAGAACARPVQVGDGPSGTTSGAVQHTGRLTVAAVAPSARPMLYLDSGRSIGLAGSLEPELARLSGARVMVEGTPATGFPGEALEVQRYEVLEVNGEKPWVGVLVRSGDAWLLRQDTGDLRLTGVPAGLAAQPGAKVWITGSLDADALRVQSFGIIRSG